MANEINTVLNFDGTDDYIEVNPVFNGFIDNFSVFNYVLSESEIKTLFHKERVEK